MYRVRVAWVFLVLAAVAAPEAAAQVIVNETRVTAGEPLQLPGMGGRQFKTGTGRVRGRVLSSDTGAPVRRAQVRLSGPEVGAKASMTDANGMYEFRELPAGRFTINASKSGFVNVQYGQTRPFESGKTIELAEAQVLDKADIHMPRGSVISGRIMDEFGDAVPDAIVTALRSTWSNGRRRLQPTGRTAQTNDLGQYRLFGLPPGEYYISASLAGVQMMNVEMALGMAGTSSGSMPSSGYAPTYYPGTTSGSEAQRVAIAVGQEAQSTDFALIPVRLARISGTVMNSEGKPVEGTMVNAVARNSDVTGPLFGMGSSARTDKNGRFTLNGVPPGDYTLQTRGVQVVSASEGRTMVFTMMGDGGGSDGSEVGSVPLSVSGEDISNLVVVTSKGGTATGSVIFEGGPTMDKSAATMRVTASAVDAEGPAMLAGGSAAVKPDGTFELKGLAGGRIIRIANLPSGWMLKAVRLNGQDITDTGAEFKAGEAVTGLDVVLTPRLTQVSGTVTGAGGAAVKDYTVVVFSDDQQRWTLPQTRWVAGVRPDQDGRFQVRNLPPGSYYAVAVDYIEQGAWGDPEMLLRLKDVATTFSLRDGETRTLELKISQ